MTKLDKNFRVYQIPEQLRQKVVAKREAEGATNAQLIDTAVESHLPRIVEDLEALGFGPDSGDSRPMRLPISDLTLAALRGASDLVGLPQSQLFALVLARHCIQGPAAAPPKPAKTKRAPRPTTPRKTRGAAKKAAPVGKKTAPAPKTSRRKTATKKGGAK